MKISYFGEILKFPAGTEISFASNICFRTLSLTQLYFCVTFISLVIFSLVFLLFVFLAMSATDVYTRPSVWLASWLTGLGCLFVCFCGSCQFINHFCVFLIVIPSSSSPSYHHHHYHHHHHLHHITITISITVSTPTLISSLTSFPFSYQTNIPFLLNVLHHAEFLDGAVNTDFIKDNPQLFDVQTSQNRAQKLLHYLGNVIINGPVTPLATTIKPSKIEPTVPRVSIFGR